MMRVRRLRWFVPLLCLTALCRATSPVCSDTLPDPPAKGAIPVLAVPHTMYLPVWLSDHELLFAQAVPFRLFCYDLNTGEHRRLAGLEALAGSAISFRVSPDGRHVLWSESRVTGVGPLGFSTGRESYAHVADVDGSHHHYWRLNGSGLPYWMHDSRHLVEVAELGPNVVHTHLLVRDSLHPRSARRYALRLPRKVYSPASMAYVSDGSLLITDAWQGVQPAIRSTEVYRKPVSVVGKDPQTFSVRLPASMHIWAINNEPVIAFARDGRHIAWLLKTDSPDRDYMNLPTELWVSTTSGTDWRLLGKQPADTLEPDRSYRNMDGLQWTPDGKRLSFYYDGFLWVTSDLFGR